MSQSEFLAGALLAAFVLYLLMTNRLQAYWALLTGGGTSAASAATGGNTAGAAQTTSGAATTSQGSSAAPGFIANTVQQLGTMWVWKDAHNGATVISHSPPPGYTPPSQ